MLTKDGDLTPELKKAFDNYLSEKLKPWKVVGGILGLLTVGAFLTSISTAHREGVNLVADKYKDKQADLDKKAESFNTRYDKNTELMSTNVGKLEKVVENSDERLKQLDARIKTMDEKATVAFNNLTDEQKRIIRDIISPSIKTLVVAELKTIDERLAKGENAISPFGNNISGTYYQWDTNKTAEQNGTDIYIVHVGRIVLMVRSKSESTEPALEVGMQIAKNEFAFKRDRLSFPDFVMESMVATEVDGVKTLYYAPRMYPKDQGTPADRIPGAAIFLSRKSDYLPKRVWPVADWTPPKTN